MLLCSALSVCALTACGSTETGNEGSSSTAVVLEEGKFDLDAVRNSVNIKGYKFTIPQTLAQLDDGLKYEFVDEEFDDGLYEVNISDKNGVILRTIVRNAHKKSKKAELYNISVDSSDSNVAGIVPHTSTKDDVLRQFGEPDNIKKSDSDNSDEIYRYGEFGYTEKYDFQHPGNFITISFDQSGIAQTIVVSYSEKE